MAFDIFLTDMPASACHLLPKQINPPMFSPRPQYMTNFMPYRVHQIFSPLSAPQCYHRVGRSRVSGPALSQRIPGYVLKLLGCQQEYRGPVYLGKNFLESFYAWLLEVVREGTIEADALISAANMPLPVRTIISQLENRDHPPYQLHSQIYQYEHFRRHDGCPDQIA
jgi:hypothetical protein